MGFTCGVTEILWNLQPEKFHLRETRAEVCKAVTWENKSGKISTIYFNARIMGIKKACQRLIFGETREISALHNTYLRCHGRLWVLDISSRRD